MGNHPDRRASHSARQDVGECGTFFDLRATTSGPSRNRAAGGSNRARIPPAGTAYDPHLRTLAVGTDFRRFKEPLIKGALKNKQRRLAIYISVLDEK